MSPIRIFLSLAIISCLPCGALAQVVDSDGDGLTDSIEALIGTDPNDSDTDNDGLLDGNELLEYDTNPLLSDTDGDGLGDGLEVFLYRTEPNLVDTDNDGLSDGAEVNTHDTKPKVADTDGDGLNDGSEVLTHTTNPKLADTDGDGLSDGAEVITHKTNPKLADTDGDGLNDGVEVNTHGTDPKLADTDGDGLNDGAELGSHGTDPKLADTDSDLLSDSAEILTHGTNPLVADTDGDKLTDYQELFVFDRTEVDPLVAGPIPVKPNFVAVGDSQNPDDDFGENDIENTGLGYVGQEYEMSVTEVTNWMYALFLNSVAKRDRLYGLYKQDMGDNAEGGIVRGGSQGSYTYTVKAGFETKPVNFVSLWDALRYINWLHNWKVRDPQMRDAFRPTLTGSQDQDASTTEDGAYLLQGKNPEVFTRHPAALFFLPDVDEWHKAAYYDPAPGGGRPSDSYWDWATQKMNPPTHEALEPSTSPLVPAGTAGANYFGPSHYGTFNQDGNVSEWVQDALILGGRAATEPVELEQDTLGFRVARSVSDTAVGPAVIPLLVEVGEPGNPDDEEYARELNDPQIGTVNHPFQMGAYEVTNRDYARFLNNMAKEEDFYGLYDIRMESDTVNGGITRERLPDGSYSYSPRRGFGLKPVVYVSIFSAMRYCNWLHNGGHAGSDMESGAYRLLGNIPPNTDQLTRNAGARYYLPKAEEFYKAAYYDPNALTTYSYWKFATRSDDYDAALNSSALRDVDAVSVSSYFGTYGQSGNVGYTAPDLGANTAPLPTTTTSGELLEEATNTDDESATRAFRIAAAAGMAGLRPLGDEDGDGLSNGWEVLNDLDPFDATGDNGATGDPDSDGLTNLEESVAKTDPKDSDNDIDGLSDFQEVRTYLTDPKNSDTDGDGLSDGAEVNTHTTDPKDSDTDNDGLPDGAEVNTHTTNPKLPDTDGDGMPDGWEIQFSLNPKSAADKDSDADSDELSNLGEFGSGTDPRNEDTDDDGMPDGWEVRYSLDPLDPSDAAEDPDGDGLNNFEEETRRTNPSNSDTDGDGMPDGWEVLNSLNPRLASDSIDDNDADGLNSLAEYTLGTKPWDSDTDDDGMPDGWEVQYGLNPLSNTDKDTDLDSDGLSNIREYFPNGTIPNNPDTDGDGMPDGWEVQYGFDPKSPADAALDTDGDGLTNLQEFNAGSDPKKTDTDGDGMPDKWEVDNGFNPASAADATGDADGDGLTNLQEFTVGTNPKNIDTDSDGMLDGWELQYSLNPLVNDAGLDADSDGLTNLQEFQRGTLPRNRDTDGDLLTDGDEVNTRGTDPLKPDTDSDGMTDYQELFVFVSNPLAPTPIPDTPFFREVGDPRNPDDDGGQDDLQNAGRGYVGQEFEIAVTEVTNLMYAKFLNAVARSDRFYGLYKEDMGTSPEGGILRSGQDGTYSYNVKPGYETKPVNFVSLWDALRYINWLHNGMPTTQVQDATTTEDGAYALRGTNPTNFTRHPAAKFYLPDVDEWHKAAYYDPNPGPGLPSPLYWDRATQALGTKLASSTLPLLPVGTRGGDYFGPSHYGTYDQDGNVEEWTQNAVILGGGVTSTDNRERASLGFRVAKPIDDTIGTQETVPLMVEVGEPGNLADEQASPLLGDEPIGAVNYVFQMGAYEVTNLEYVKFLNAKAKSDSFYRLFDSRMERYKIDDDEYDGGILRSGEEGSYSYFVRPGFAKKPVVFVSIYSAMRYCNWLHNGGGPNSDTEDGAYRLLGNIPTNTDELTRNVGARYYLPNANEFYKAAYYDSSAAANVTFDYWRFATRSDSYNPVLNNSAPADVNSTSDSDDDNLYDVGAASFFGTYGQNGNVGYDGPGSGVTAPTPTAANTGELLEEATNTDDESATRTFRIAAAVGVRSLPPLGDEDSDGLPNAWELLHGLDPFDNGVDNLRTPTPNDGNPNNGANGDPDGEGLLNSEEYASGADPLLTDTDGDGLDDRVEVKVHGTDPAKPDTDGDGMPDKWEVDNGFNPLDPADAGQDADNDGLTNLREFQLGTDPNDSDSDDDGLTDGAEADTHGTDPKDNDTDNDGMPDGWEVQYSLNPLVNDAEQDPDADGLTNLREFQLGTNPRNPDTDDDGLTDGAEVDTHRTDPLDNDTDNDGLSDGAEVNIHGTDPKHIDTDNDGFSDGQEVNSLGTGPLTPETVPFFVRVGNAGNPDDIYSNPLLSGVVAQDSVDRLGAVGYGFDIAATEVTNLMYARFLNAVARLADPNGLYDDRMKYDPYHGGLERSIGSAPYTYTVKPGFEACPVTFISFYDAIRYINWLHNGMPTTGVQDVTTTESGAYNIGASRITRSPGALYHLPDEDEWHKAAFYDPNPGSGLPSQFYWPYAEQSTSTPFGDVPDDNEALYAAASRGPASHYGTYDQGGGVKEWIEHFDNLGTSAGLVDGLDYSGNVPHPPHSGRAGSEFAPTGLTGADYNVGFRVARSLGLPAVADPDNLPTLMTVAEARNSGDASRGGMGSIGYEYRIGKYEVTNLDYARFLNAAARYGDEHGLYDDRMGYFQAIDTYDPAKFTVTGGIIRSISSGVSTYTVRSNYENKPVNYVSYENALRYCNWLHNGGRPDSDTEDGAYRMSGRIKRQPGARVFLPNRDEWYKAAAYDSAPSAASTSNYWDFAYRSDLSDATKLAIVPSRGLYEVSSPGFASYFGTFGQSANAAEFIEVNAGSDAVACGGSVLTFDVTRPAGYTGAGVQTWQSFTMPAVVDALLSAKRYDVGLRIAALPAATPSSFASRYPGADANDKVNGSPALLDYFHGGTASVPAPAEHSPRHSLINGKMNYTFVVRTDDASLAYQVQTATNAAGPWSSDKVVPLVPATVANHLERRTYEVQLSGEKQRFFRLVVEP